MMLLYGIIGLFMLLAWPMLVLLHELGHAIPALLFTRADVVMYLGSYGDSSNSWRVRIGLLEIYFKRSPFWAGGLCIHTGSNLTKLQHIVVVLGGVVVSLVVATLGFYGALVFDLHGFIKLLLFFLTILAAVTLVANPLPMEHGGFANDGLLLKRLLTGDRQAESFSPELRDLIAKSREIALALGYDYISTLHVLLADCALPYAYSLRHLLFTAPDADAQLAAFYESGRVGPARRGGSVPISVSFEDALLLAQSIGRQYGLRPGKLLPCHLLLAATSLPGSELSQVLQAEPPATLTENLLAYYRNFPELLAP